MRPAMLLLAFLPLDALAQVPTLMQGSRAKITAVGFGSTLTGTVMAQTADTIRLAESGAVMRNIPTTSVREIKVSGGRSSGAGALKGAKIGFGIGGIVSLALISAIALEDGSGVRAQDVATFTLVNATSGALWGAAIGAFVKAERWNRVYGMRARLAIQPTPQDVAVGLSLRF